MKEKNAKAKHMKKFRPDDEKHRQRRALTETENYSRLCSISCLTLLYHKCADIGATTALIYLMVQHDIFIPFTLEAVCPSNTH